ncbi:sigma-70 family RNA polymerase sigma factor [Mesomycoplasma conjunctivae]|uniref:sigma-70 family RNA polymerase sigma factor n=1 Tax=Mesomycoplasma conjunctivae TaxID=45361 RepID=UPI003DA36095
MKAKPKDKTEKSIRRFYNKVIAEYSNLITACSKQVIYKFPNIPLSWEDLYNHSLPFTVELYKKFNPELGIPISNYLIHNLKLHMMWYCNSFMSKNSQILNHAVSIDELYDNPHFSSNDFDDEFEIKDIFQRITSGMDEIERKIFHCHFLEDKTTKEISHITGITSQKINKIIQKFQEKIESYIL